MAAVVKKSASEKIQDESTAAVADVDLTDAPKLKPYRTLRIRERKGIMALFDDLGGEDAATKGVELSMSEGIEVLAKMDEALESVALDRDEYVAWAVGEDAEARVMALFNRYAEQVGESMRSAS